MRGRRWKQLEARVSAASQAGCDWLWESDAEGVLTWVSDSVIAHRLAGFELLQRLRAVDGLQDVPACMCSADAMPEDLQRAHAAGFAGYWTTPIDIGQVVAELNADRRPRA